jgi:hypothetical protein
MQTVREDKKAAQKPQVLEDAARRGAAASLPHEADATFLG